MVTQTAAAVKTLTIAEHTAPVSTWKRAYARAHTDGVKVLTFQGHWYATSASHPGELHHVNGSCDCEGAQHSRICKHFVAVASARALQGELAACAACGRVLPLAEMESEWRHVGGQDDRLELYCGKGHGHQAGR